MLGAVSQTRVSGGNRTHDPHANQGFRIITYIIYKSEEKRHEPCSLEFDKLFSTNIVDFRVQCV